MDRSIYKGRAHHLVKTVDVLCNNLGGFHMSQAGAGKMPSIWSNEPRALIALGKIGGAIGSV